MLSVNWLLWWTIIAQGIDSKLAAQSRMIDRHGKWWSWAFQSRMLLWLRWRAGMRPRDRRGVCLAQQYLVDWTNQINEDQLSTAGVLIAWSEDAGIEVRTLDLGHSCGQCLCASTTSCGAELACSPAIDECSSIGTGISLRSTTNQAERTRTFGHPYLDAGRT